MSQRFKPRIVQDIQPKYRRTVFNTNERKLVNLTYTRPKRFRMPWMQLTRTTIAVAGVLFLIIGSVNAPTSLTNAQTNDQERAQLQQQLDQLQKEMDAAAAQRDAYSKQKNSLSSEVGKLNSTISGLQAQIKAINTSLSSLNNKIGTTESQIEVTSASLDDNKVILGNLMQTMYKNDQTSLLEIFLQNKQLSDFFTNANNVATVQDNIRATIGKIASLQDQLQAHKNDLTLTRNDVLATKSFQTSQESRIQEVKSEKTQLLAVTKGQEAKYQQLYSEKKAAADKIRARLFELLGGGNISFGAAYQYAQVASNATGVRTALILAVLDHESALGRNVGSCSYQTSMNPTRDIPVFLSIVQSLGIDPNNVKVSCAIPADGAYGGAMGPAQFLPSTWMKYSSRIASITGHNPANPWNNQDAFIATALYLQDAGAAGGNVSSERVAAAKYYAGGNWSRYLYTYGQAVIDRAAQFEDDIQTLLAAK
jgi:peptidoglycan hydrolase CwlO-like protein